MRCRRCNSSSLIRLDKKYSKDNDVYRCQECGFLFSPAAPAETIELQPESTKTLINGPAKTQKAQAGREPPGETVLGPAAEAPESANSGSRPTHGPGEEEQS